MLWVTDEVPDAQLGGGSIRQFHLLKRLAERASVDLLLVGRLRDDRLRSSLRKVIELDRPEPSGTLRRWVTSRQAVWPGALPTEVALAKPLVTHLRLAAERLEEYDVVQIEHEWLAHLLRPRVAHRARWAITLHNLLSVRVEQQAALSSQRRTRWIQARDAKHGARFERAITADYDLTIVVSEADARALGGRALVVPNGVDLDLFRPSPLPAAPSLLFTASWSWAPNTEAAIWLCREVLPIVQAAVPETTVTLVGRQPNQSVGELAQLAGVDTHFDVPSVLPHLEAARVAVVPVRVGSGTRLKALEAMAAGRPLAGTAIGLEGLGLNDGVSAAVGDDAEDLAAQIIRLCRDDAYAHALSDAARSIAEHQFGWDQIASSYIDQLMGVVTRVR